MSHSPPARSPNARPCFRLPSVTHERGMTLRRTARHRIAQVTLPEVIGGARWRRRAKASRAARLWRRDGTANFYASLPTMSRFLYEIMHMETHDMAMPVSLFIQPSDLDRAETWFQAYILISEWTTPVGGIRTSRINASKSAMRRVSNARPLTHLRRARAASPRGSQRVFGPQLDIVQDETRPLVW
jgi:hypothetical protein